MSNIRKVVMGWLDEEKYKLNDISVKNASGYRIERGNSYPVNIIFPDNKEDLCVIQGGVNISGKHWEVIDSISDPVELKRIMDSLNYEIMSNTDVGSSKKIEDNKIRGVAFESEIYYDGANKTLFFDKVVAVRSALLKFISFINKEF